MAWPRDISKARILISNDDGFYAPGLQVLVRIALSISEDVWVVAPETEQSGAGHSLTLRRPLQAREHQPNWYSVNGTPTDCVLLAVNLLMKDKRPDIVLSGVNRNGNLAEDMTYSGTVSAAMEATILGVPAIAFSQELIDGEPADWTPAETYGPDLLRRILKQGFPPHTLLNVNFPPVSAEQVRGTRVTSQGKRKNGDDIMEVIDPRGAKHYWIGHMQSMRPYAQGTDLAAIDDGYISVTPIKMDMTDTVTLAELQRAFAGEDANG
ncbi:5'/3'-nucleotidase SurE [Nisaea sp.]|uniref:5'/3'-nucleotidase SurE n=1 Tax=Nisaea sp. TaxID=2024842 RepID=UPI003B5240A0